ncbi:MAG: hypothetical protein DME68_08920 [Verrucomicrobia bacterium]|nr:MAG: hypothetical protein DME68_08920 [Verrucomicrobiota bacterium]
MLVDEALQIGLRNKLWRGAPDKFSSELEFPHVGSVPGFELQGNRRGSLKAVTHPLCVRLLGQRLLIDWLITLARLSLRSFPPKWYTK